MAAGQFSEWTMELGDLRVHVEDERCSGPYAAKVRGLYLPRSASTITPSYDYVHLFEIREVADLDHELLGLLREARARGDLQHLVQKHTR
jgi:hypothetical protein